MRRLPRLLVSLAILLAAAPGLFAGEIEPASAAAPADSTVATAAAEGKRLFAAGDYAAAVEHLEKAYRGQPDDPDVAFLLGRAAFESGDYELALTAYSHLLAKDPTLDRVRLEQARTHKALGNRALARKFYQDVLANGPPDAVKATIANQLAQLDREEQKHFLTGAVSAGIANDTNPRVAPLGGILDTIFGPLDLPPSARPVSDIYSYGFVGLDHTYRPSPDTPWRWRTGFASYNALYGEQSDLDLNFAQLSTGIGHETSRLSWDLRAFAEAALQDGRKNLWAPGARLTVRVPLPPRALLAFTGRVDNRRLYPTVDPDTGELVSNRDRDGVYGFFEAGATLFFTRARLTFRGGYDYANATDAFRSNSYDRWSAGIEASHTIRGPWEARIGWRHQELFHRETDGLFLKRRRDHVDDWMIGLRRSLGLRGRLDLDYGFSRARSNISLYDYKRSLVRAGVTFFF